MNIQSLLCNSQPIVEAPTKFSQQLHERQSSWSSYSSLPDSPLSSSSSSSSLVYSIPSSPDLDTPPVRRGNHSQTRTPWSNEEDQLLQQGYSQGLSWAMISTVYLPHRSRGCCWGRFKTLQSKSLEQREWSDAEDKLLALAIKKNSRLFKQAWKAVAQDMGNRNWKECESRSTKTTTNMINKKKY